MIGEKKQIHVFIVGCKGIPAAYGGFETFVDQLVQNRSNENIQYHVACMNANEKCFTYHGADCFSVTVPQIGSAKAVLYDLMALNRCISWCKRDQKIEKPIFYVLASRIGPFMARLARRAKKVNGTLLVNPDGHEWLRGKWSKPIRLYWKFSEKLMAKHADRMVCDSRAIENYIKEEYVSYQPRTAYIPYGSIRWNEIPSADGPYRDWLAQMGTEEHGYYLMVGRFVPENNFETVIREFMRSKTKNHLIMITTENARLKDQLETQLHFSQDARIHLAGSVYDPALLAAIRTGACGYIHGHEVGGTNPSLLEALSFTAANLLLDVEFNREVGKDGALYWTKAPGNLSALIEKTDQLTPGQAAALEEKAKARITEEYNWDHVASEYERLFLSEAGKAL